jgi:hypothetical protein
MMFMKGIAAIVVAIAPVSAFVPGASFGVRQPLSMEKVRPEFVDTGSECNFYF